jgi:integrase
MGIDFFSPRSGVRIMASVDKDTKGWRVRFYDQRGSRRTLRLSGKVSKREAQMIARHVDHLQVARQIGCVVQQQTAVWIQQISDSFYLRLQKLDLVEPRADLIVSKIPTFAEYYSKYRARMASMKSTATLRKWDSATKKVFAAPDRIGDMQLDKVTLGHIRNVESWMASTGLAEATYRKNLQIIKQIFDAAAAEKITDNEPFNSISVSSSASSVKAFVRHNIIDDAIRGCDDIKMQMVMAMARYTGLRVPSELVPLRWTDVDFLDSRINIYSPKTQMRRVIPLFKELRPILERGREAASAHDERIFPDVTPETNLRKPMREYVEAAGHEMWPKAFVSLRSTREIELKRIVGLDVATKWIGNSAAVAMQHYLEPTEDDFEKVLGLN